MKTRVLNQIYSCKGVALAAANYLKSFGYDAEAKHLNNVWRVVIHENI